MPNLWIGSKTTRESGFKKDADSLSIHWFGVDRSNRSILIKRKRNAVSVNHLWTWPIINQVFSKERLGVLDLFWGCVNIVKQEGKESLQYSKEHMKTITYANFWGKQSVLWGFENRELNILLMKSYFSRLVF